MTDITAADRNRAEQLTERLHCTPPNTDHEAVRAYVHDLAEAGLAVMFVRPDSKAPADPRTSRERTAADKAARAAAKAAGKPRWHEVKAPAGLTLATTDADTLDTNLTNYLATRPDGIGVNLAVEVGGSGLVVVDADTPEQVAAFLADSGGSLDVPTVSTPGQRDPATDEFVHHDGGHWYFTVPEGVDLPCGTGAATLGSGAGYSVLWDRRYVLIPSSTRPEGEYKATGDVLPLPGWLRDKISAEAGKRVERAAQRQHRTTEGGDKVKRWGAGITWAEILAATDWINTGKPDSCGCDIWTAPGPHASPKSATAHELGCAVPGSDDPCLHIWTDHDIEPFGAVVDEHGPHLTRLRAVAAIHHDDNLGAAMTALDLHDDDDLSFPGPVADSGAGHSGGASLNLPDEFWDQHPVLGHIRQFAHHGVNSADAVLGAALTRLSAYLDPSVRVNTGVKRPLPLNMFAGLVGSAGTGKSSAHQAAADLLSFVFPDPMTTELLAGHQRPPELPVGSGPGVAEAFMGTVIDMDDPTGKTKVRRQVLHKVLFYCDEGAALVAGILDNKRGQDIGPTLRAAWTGAVLGQQNASADRTRQVRDYSLGLCAGFQLEAVAAFSTPEQLEYGTPQRFVYFSATDPSVPDDAGDDPGALEVRMPVGLLHYDAELRDQARREALSRARGGGSATADPMQAHRPALEARCAALLMILCDPGRTEIRAADVELAGYVLDTSARLHDAAMEWRRERETSERERQSAARITEQVATAAAVDNRAVELDKLGEAILRHIGAAGGRASWGGRDGIRAKIRSDKRQLADTAIDRLVNDDKVARDEDADTLTRL